MGVTWREPKGFEGPRMPCCDHCCHDRRIKWHFLGCWQCKFERLRMTYGK